MPLRKNNYKRIQNINKKAQNSMVSTLGVLILTIVLISVIFAVTSSRFKKLTGTETSGAVNYQYSKNTNLEYQETFLEASKIKSIKFSKSNDKIAINEEIFLLSESCGDFDT